MDSGPTEPITDEATNEEHVVLALENTNTSQAAEISTLKERLKKLEKKRRSRTYKPRRLYKDASKPGRKIADLDADTEVTLIDETQWRNDEDLMFDTGVFLMVMRRVYSCTDFDRDKSAKPKAVTTAATIVTPASSRPKAKGIAKDKGKAKMVEPEKPLKKKDQIAIDKEVSRNLEAQLQAELEEEERLSRQKEEEANIALIES
ncbi:hypothetical protein Tco_1128526 [Tanacetum coccineum]